MDYSKAIIDNFLLRLRELMKEDDELHDSLTPAIRESLQAYWEAEQKVYADYKYDYAETCYEFVICNRKYDKVKIIATDEDSFQVMFEWEDRDGETFKWTLSVPFDMTNLPKNVERWRDKIVIDTELKIKRKKKAEKAKRKAEFEKLSREFETETP